MSFDSQIIEADWTWTGERFMPGIQIEVSNGRIQSVGRKDEKPNLRLKDQALLPGFVNAHSHAFQRGLRGRGETFPEGQGSFWTWRQAMYDLVEKITPDEVYRLTLQAFREMLGAGITAVGEFHYLHHENPDSRDYRFDEIVLSAAQEAGIRIVLLNTYYNTGSIGSPLQGAQRRFGSSSVEEFLLQHELLAGRLKSSLQSLGIVAHSIRAASLDDIEALFEYSQRLGCVFQMHVEEQRLEIEECVKAYGKPPLALLLKRLDLGETFTGVHCTHSRSEDLEAVCRKGANVCICPLTEASLGDGLADGPLLVSAGGTVCVGTDSNARISIAEELRWLEYGQRLKRESRGIFSDGSGGVARTLIKAATLNGSGSLGIRAGRIEAGAWADFVTLDLMCESMQGWTPETLLECFIFGSGNSAVSGTCVAGRWLDTANQRDPSERHSDRFPGSPPAC